MSLAKMKKFCGYGNTFLLLLLGVLILVLIIVVCMMIICATWSKETFFDVDRDTATVEFISGTIQLTGFTLIILLLERIMVSTRDDNSPFTMSNARNLKIMAIVSLVTGIVLVIGEGTAISLLEVEGYDMNFPLMEFGGTLVFYILALVFRYGAELQKQSDETL